MLRLLSSACLIGLMVGAGPVMAQKPAAPPAAPPAPAAVDRTLADGEELPHAGGIVVIYTPGHSPGHLCLYHKRSRSLITGDALNVSEGLLAGPNPVHTPDVATALASLKQLAAYDIETVICYHGGVYRGDANRRIAELADGR